jgi:hypothetical protein
MTTGREVTMPSEVQEDLEGLQNALLNSDSVEQFLHELAVLSAQAMDGMMSCAMFLRQPGRPSSVTACSDPLASSADDGQHQADDGPSLHAMRHARPVRIDDTAAGALILYAERPAAFGPEEIEHVAQDRALALLRSVSQNTNVRLRDLAASIVTRVSGMPPQPASPFEEDD